MAEAKKITDEIEAQKEARKVKLKAKLAELNEKVDQTQQGDNEF